MKDNLRNHNEVIRYERRIYWIKMKIPSSASKKLLDYNETTQLSLDKITELH